MDRYLTKKELAAELKISIPTIDRWIQQRRLPFIKLGSVRFDSRDVEAFMDAHKIPAAAEMAEEDGWDEEDPPEEPEELQGIGAEPPVAEIDPDSFDEATRGEP